MIWSIAKKEILENIFSYRFSILTVLLALLMAVAVIVGYGDFLLRLENYEVLRPMPNSPNIIIEPTPMSMFAKGLEANLTRLYEVSILGIEIRQNQQSVNRIFSLFAVPDILFIIKVVLALIAVLFSFDAITHEKEQGTLKLTLSNGIRRSSLVVGKFAGRFVLVFVPFTVLFLLALLTMSLLPSVAVTSSFWWKNLVILLASCVYTLLFTGVGLFVSSIIHRSSTSMVVSLSIWLLFVFIIPNFSTVIAKRLTPVPTSDRIEMETRLNTIQAIYNRIQREKEEPRGMEGVRMIRQLRESTTRITELYRPKMNALMRTTKSLVRISPSGALNVLLTDIANTGLYEEVRAKDAVTQYVERNFNRINELEPGPIELFRYTRASLGEVFSATGYVDVVVILFFATLFIAAAYVRFLIYDPR
ncbi:MAG: ABC transporter permease [Ignavibacteria bacterium]|nr:ABC transporter permease [Ignavibacteria bacterium]